MTCLEATYRSPKRPFPGLNKMGFNTIVTLPLHKLCRILLTVLVFFFSRSFTLSLDLLMELLQCLTFQIFWISLSDLKNRSFKIQHRCKLL